MSTPRPIAFLFASLLLGTAFGVACDKVPLLAPTQATITLIPSTTVVAANGTASITANVIEQSGTPVQNGTVVTFTSSFGSVEPREARTTNGQATVEFRGSGQSGTAKIGAFSGGIKATELEILVGGAAADRVLLRAEPATVVTTGSTVQLVATVLDASGNGISGLPVTFTANNGTLVSSQVITDGAGTARTSLTTNRNTSVTANAGSKSATLELTAVTAPSVTIALSGTGAAEAGAPLNFTVTPPSGGLQLTGVTINWGDGTTSQLGAITAATQVAHTFASPGQYTITATGTDSGGNSASSTLVLAVTERSTVPVTITASPSVVSLGTTQGLVNFTVSTGGTGTSTGSIRFYEWSFGDGASTVTTGPAVSYRYSATGNYTVRVRVTTTTGAEGFGQAQVRVSP